eukprot:1151592-Pelagomonas_calceolata.AAC.2
MKDFGASATSRTSSAALHKTLAAFAGSRSCYCSCAETILCETYPRTYPSQTCGTRDPGSTLAANPDAHDTSP